MGYHVGEYAFERGGLFSNDRHIFGDIICEVSARGDIRKIELDGQIVAEDGIYGLGALLLRREAEQTSASRLAEARQSRDQAIEAARAIFDETRQRERESYTESERTEQLMLEDLLQGLREGVLDEAAALYFNISPDFLSEFKQDEFFAARRERLELDRLAEHARSEEEALARERERERASEERNAREAEARVAAERRRAEAMASKAAEDAARVTSYIAQLDREIASLPQVSATNYTGSVEQINIGIILLGTWTMIYEQGSEIHLDPAAQQKRQRFREILVLKQAEFLPVLRDAYGPAMRRQLRDADGSARTFGPGYRTVEFVNSAFVRDANMRTFQNEIREHLLMLRFTRAQYKRSREASEYSYYTLEPPRDTDLVIWEAGARYRVLP